MSSFKRLSSFGEVWGNCLDKRTWGMLPAESLLLPVPYWNHHVSGSGVTSEKFWAITLSLFKHLKGSDVKLSLYLHHTVCFMSCSLESVLKEHRNSKIQVQFLPALLKLTSELSVKHEILKPYNQGPYHRSRMDTQQSTWLTSILDDCDDGVNSISFPDCTAKPSPAQPYWVSFSDSF